VERPRVSGGQALVANQGGAKGDSLVPPIYVLLEGPVDCCGLDERKRLVAIGFDLASDTYDGAWNRSFDLQAEALVREAHIPEGAKILDVATGTGKVVLLAARAVGPQGQVVGVDLSEGMLAQARRNAAGLPIAFQKMDAETLAFEHGSFDSVLCGFGVAFFPDKVRCMQEMCRVLRPGGRVIFSWWTKDAFQPMDETITTLLEHYGIPRPPVPPEPWLVLKEPEHLLILMEKGGFQEGRVVREEAGHFITPEDWWQLMWGSGWRRYLNPLSAESLERFRNETLEEIGRLRTDKGIWLDASAHIGIGVRGP